MLFYLSLQVTEILFANPGNDMYSLTQTQPLLLLPQLLRLMGILEIPFFFFPFLPLGCLSKLSSCSLKIRRLLGQIKICKLFNLFFVWLLRKLGKRKEKKLEFNAYSLSFVCCCFQMGADDFSFCFFVFF